MHYTSNYDPTTRTMDIILSKEALLPYLAFKASPSSDRGVSFSIYYFMQGIIAHDFA